MLMPEPFQKLGKGERFAGRVIDLLSYAFFCQRKEQGETSKICLLSYLTKMLFSQFSPERFILTGQRRGRRPLGRYLKTGRSLVWF